MNILNYKNSTFINDKSGINEKSFGFNSSKNNTGLL